MIIRKHNTCISSLDFIGAIPLFSYSKDTSVNTKILCWIDINQSMEDMGQTSGGTAPCLASHMK